MAELDQVPLSIFRLVIGVGMRVPDLQPLVNY